MAKPDTLNYLSTRIRISAYESAAKSLQNSPVTSGMLVHADRRMQVLSLSRQTNRLVSGIWTGIHRMRGDLWGYFNG